MGNKINCNICNKLIVENNLEEHVSSREHINNKNTLIKELNSNKNNQDFLESVVSKWQI
jgi:hypothetical protein